MARTDWAALYTEPLKEYIARTELERLGLRPYLPQCRRQHLNPLHHRHYPLFPRYLFLPFGQAYNPLIRQARGLVSEPLLATDGRPWRATAEHIEALHQAELAGRFDEAIQPGTVVTFRHISAVLASVADARTVELFTPLFGGSKATAKAVNLTRPHRPD